AVGEVEVLVVSKAAFAPVLDRYPDLAEHISRLLAQRRQRLADHTDSMRPHKRRDSTLEEESGQLLEKIRSFFSL
ncbi:MAG: hypothetical protein AAGA56_17705, partial [Myxococcota bacterium]